MNTDTGDMISLIGDVWQALSASALFSFGKWFLILYTLVLIVDVILLILLRGVTANLKTQIYGAQRPLTSKSAVQKRWEKITARLTSENASQYKVAILEADHLADELLSGSGYVGSNMGERLKSIQPGQLESLKDLVEAHSVRNRIVNEPDFVLSRDETEVFLEKYRKYFSEMELF